jgi:hypothetical protein
VFSNPREGFILQITGFSPGENAPSSPINPIRIINPEFKDLAQTWGWKDDYSA